MCREVVVFLVHKESDYHEDQDARVDPGQDVHCDRITKLDRTAPGVLVVVGVQGHGVESDHCGLDKDQQRDAILPRGDHGDHDRSELDAVANQQNYGHARIEICFVSINAETRFHDVIICLGR